MSVEDAYNLWADQYDTNKNLTRDMEATALRTMLKGLRVDECLEVGCGTGKNTGWLLTVADRVTAIDFSEQMLVRAREKYADEAVQFIRADIKEEWHFATGPYDLIIFSLVLEHIEFLHTVFIKAASVLKPGGLLYIGELHPFKQYMGTRARYETRDGQQFVHCFNHHVSDFVMAAEKAGLRIRELREYFDSDNREAIPRILSIRFEKQE